MVRLDKIYTRGGDAGETGLGDGSRVSKAGPRVAAIGAVDETNAAIGIARLDADGERDAMLGRIQNELFDLGADLCVPEDGRKAEGALRVTPAQVARLEAEIDAMNASLAPLTSFILPGGTPLAAHLHMPRTIARRADTRIAALAGQEPAQPLFGAAIGWRGVQKIDAEVGCDGEKIGQGGIVGKVERRRILYAPIAAELDGAETDRAYHEAGTAKRSQLHWAASSHGGAANSGIGKAASATRSAALAPGVTPATASACSTIVARRGAKASLVGQATRNGPADCNTG